MAEKLVLPVFKFSDYDCIGFDLDNTLARYKIGAMIELMYGIICKYLVENKGYSKEHLLKPLDNSFLLKGLIIDDINGNLLRINSTGEILAASHGTKMLSKTEIGEVYVNNHFTGTDALIFNPLKARKSENTYQTITLIDYYDIAVSLIFARAVDSIDELNGREKSKSYSIWPDLLDALCYMLYRENYSLGVGGYFSALLSNPEKYYYKCSETLINWLKELKAKGKVLFLVTGSNVDFAIHTASNTLGPDWQSLFDIVVGFAKKPGFFTLKRKFRKYDNVKMEQSSMAESLTQGKIYYQGNWTDLRKFLTALSSKTNPCFLYMGDNILEDVYTPSVYAGCDTIAICEELEAEGYCGYQKCHPDKQFLVSSKWGSFFYIKSPEILSNWYHMMLKHSKICIPSIEYAATLPIDHAYKVNNLP